MGELLQETGLGLDGGVVNYDYHLSIHQEIIRGVEKGNKRSGMRVLWVANAIKSR